MTREDIEVLKKELDDLRRIVETLALGDRLAQLAARIATLEAAQEL